MTIREIRGKRIFWFFASFIAITKIISIGSAFSQGLEHVKWLKSVIQPLFPLIMLWFIWKGENWAKWIFGIVQLISGIAMIYICTRVIFIFANRTPADDAQFFFRIVGIPVGIILAFGIFDFITGLIFLASPSLRAYMAGRRESQHVYIRVMK